MCLLEKKSVFSIASHSLKENCQRLFSFLILKKQNCSKVFKISRFMGVFLYNLEL